MALVQLAREADFEFKAGDLAEDQIRVAGFKGVEGVSEPFRFDLELVSTDSGIEFDQVVGKAGLLTIGGLGAERFVNGIISRFEQRKQGKRFTTYFAQLVPSIARLALSAKSRIHQKQTVEEIVSQVLQDAGLASDRFKFSLKGALPKREYCVQYRETDLAFISRLLEEEGIFYYFEHSKESHVLVLVDDIGTTETIAGEPKLPFKPVTGKAADEEHITGFWLSQKVRTGAARLRDFDFVTPSKTLESDKQADIEDDWEVYDYPGRYANPDNKAKDEEEAKRLAQMRLEELRADRLEARGESICRRLVAGYRVEMEGHPRPDDKLPKFNGDYLLLRVRHEASQPQVRDEEAAGEEFAYSNSFECVPADTAYRPPRVTPGPILRGVQTAIVVGPSGEEIYTDEHGRVKVQFHWDREGKKDENSSCWIRVSQGWAGPSWGAMFIPRIGQEVIVDFEEGDPDRPIITGRVYHGTNKPPYKLPDDKTKSTIKSDSSPGGGGSNELRFEDKKGKEEVFVHAQKDLNQVVENDRSESIGHDRSLSVGHDKSETVDNDKSIKVDGKHTETVKKETKITITEGNYSHDVAKGTSTSHVKKAVVENYDDTQTTTVKKTIKIDGKADIVVQAADQITLHTGDSLIVMKKSGDISISGKNISITGKKEVKSGVGTQNVTLNPQKVETGGAAITSAAVGVHEITGAIVKIN
jgi:type VI secretion system secreted protein VgrG